MENEPQNGSLKKRFSRFVLLLATPEPKFLLPGSIPVIIGTSLGFAVSRSLDVLLAILALLSIVALNAGSNMTNDYFDHLSGNDWLNKNPTPFGGGSGYIQKGIISPFQMISAALILLALGSLTGLVIVFITKSFFILILGLIGLVGGFFWTAPPLRFCYRFIGEPYIFTLFGPLPVYGAYYLQTRSIDFLPLLPAVIIGLLIAMVAEINSFPDRQADLAVNKKTFVVRYGPESAVKLYRICIALTYPAALTGLFFEPLFWACLLYICTFPLALFGMKIANAENLTKNRSCLPNKFTIAFHSLAGLLLSLGFIIHYFTSQP